LKAENLKVRQASGHIAFIITAGLLLLLSVILFAYLQEPLWIFLPLCMLLALVLVQHPQLLLYSLFISIPWSIEFKIGSLGTDLPDEPLMWLTTIAVIIALIQSKLSVPLKSHPILWILLLQLAWTTITVILSHDAIISFKYLLAKFWYLLAFVLAPLVFMQKVEVLKRGMLLLLGSAMAVMIYSLVKHAFYGFSFENVNDALLPHFRNHVNYSSLIVCMVPVLIAAIRLSTKKIRNIFILLLILTLAGLYFSYARGAWAALLAGLLAYWLLQKRLLLFSFLLFIILSIAGILWLKHEDRYLKYAHKYASTIFHKDFKEHIIATYKLRDLSSAERYYRWIAGIRMARDEWAQGYGPNAFYYNYKPYTIPAFKTWVSKNEERSTVHNYFLLLLIEQGVPGLIIFIVLIGFLFWYAQRIYHQTIERFWRSVVGAAASTLTMLCVLNFLSDLVETDKAGSIFYLTIAVIILADIKTRRSDLPSHIERIS
jgi:O-antigen ligase